MRNTVLVVDGGGRGAVLVDKYAQSEHVDRVLAVPGNDLMKINTDKSVITYPKVKTTSVREILEICVQEKVNLVDVAQDNAVEAGLLDALVEKGIPTVGPTKKAGQIEWDKAWAREFGERHDIPQPCFKVCSSPQEGFDYIESQPNQPWFIKASGLAEGKGALPAKNNEEAKQQIKEMARFKKAGEVFLIEQWLRGDDDSAGEEFSSYIFSDGKNYKIVGHAQDHKRVNNFDVGENTGGMGCSTPPLVLEEELLTKVERTILDRVINGLHQEGRPYKGVLYLGGMAVKEKSEQVPYVVEFNARWGDPEAEVILPGLENDLFEVGMAIAEGDLSSIQLKTDSRARVVIAGASKGYPGNYQNVKGKQIFGLNEARKYPGVKIYSAGINEQGGRHFANGGRLFYIVGEGNNAIEARQKAYEAMSMVSIDGNNLHYRTDIGWRDVQRLRLQQALSLSSAR
ncbi:MAG: phosphoribosylamine--glycine ligase [Candidatus Abawacabacteria bacterium RBG_16_42_10]|uniref:phosphoribosylamine--glycine ligase n=1 Tax=Candidatus Abawacabacteria bacterium RBG_16_42_10 TaxID=1817814 RepID=A0A1F4XKA3_9BACT|nr:MAG: phosphoribosylamine--glycine ligase [Candidatus Abawacabacteria bacterium RBG_16_42_10]